MHKKITQYLLQKRTGTTISPSNFIPMILTDEEEAKQIMAGNILMRAVLSPDEARQLTDKILVDMRGKSSVDTWQDGYILNFADLDTKSLNMLPLIFSENGFQRPTKKQAALGKYAVIITEPAEFIRRIAGYYKTYHANQMMIEVCSAQYKDIMLEPAQYDIYARPKADSWKKEILVLARIKPGVVLNEGKEPQNEMISIGNISDIAVIVETKDMSKGKMPACIDTPEYQNWMESFEVPPKEVRGWRLSVGANIKEIAPVNKWIQLFEQDLPKEEWKAVSFLDKLFADGEAVPRLAFYRTNDVDRIFFKINRVEFHFASYGNKEQAIVENLLKCAEKETGTRFCHICLETNADLGTVIEKKIVNHTGYSEERTYIKNHLMHFHKLEMDYRLGLNVMGVNTAKKSWHYTVSVRTPDDEHILWYSAADVLNFYWEAAAANMADIEFLMKGNVYARYHKMR